MLASLRHARGWLRQESSTSNAVDAVVIGAGVVGLAVAQSLAQAGREVVVLEAANAVGTETSSRNSEIIHAGIYYPPGTLKARLCLEGNARLYEYCDSHAVPYKRLGKLLVATNAAQIPKLKHLQETGQRNGVKGLEWLDQEEVREMEPALHCVAALHSASTGVVDSHTLMLAYQGEAEAHGASVAYNSRLISGDVGGAVKTLVVEDVVSGERSSLACRMVVNAAGLHSQAVAGRLQGLPSSMIPPRYLARGCYFSLSGKSPFSRLIYPVPEDGGLGVHLTLDLGGQAKFGPDVEWVDRIDYTVDPARAASFYPAVRHYWPELKDGALQPSYAGIRPKLHRPGEPPADFMVQGPKEHGVNGLVNLFGIESPGLTSSLSIADLVKSKLL
ncbi:hypothetical protein WJX72_009503 [[Myrmecia] bisecta]|uniref:L-2-hydroxyglutarate dehydrogenase, mitochondrial n=1 Tax=[Myrmecia] bisecta TaxID=41462 RepID=A0AAW1QG00_9CHLO